MLNETIVRWDFGTAALWDCMYTLRFGCYGCRLQNY